MPPKPSTEKIEETIMWLVEYGEKVLYRPTPQEMVRASITDLQNSGLQASEEDVKRVLEKMMVWD